MSSSKVPEGMYAYKCDILMNSGVHKRVDDPNYHVYLIRGPSGQEIEMTVHTVTDIAPTIRGTHPDFSHFIYVGKVVRFVRNLRKPSTN
jgi:hypothetical protein